MTINSNILLIIIAGLINGSFVIPSRYVRNIPHAKIWFYYTIVGLLIIPWVFLFLISPRLMDNYFAVEPRLLIFLITSGIIFGIGQLCFIYAIEAIGVALSFMINLGLGVTIGSMFVVFYRAEFFTYQGYLVTLAVFLILLALIIHYLSGKNALQNISIDSNIHENYYLGWLLAFCAGITSMLTTHCIS